MPDLPNLRFEPLVWLILDRLADEFPVEYAEVERLLEGLNRDAPFPRDEWSYRRVTMTSGTEATIYRVSATTTVWVTQGVICGTARVFLIASELLP